METEQLGRLRDILEASRLVAVYVKETTETAFRADTQKQDAVIRRIEVIGEAVAHLTETTHRTIPELPLRQMRGMRNIVAHGPLVTLLMTICAVIALGACPRIRMKHAWSKIDLSECPRINDSGLPNGFGTPQIAIFVFLGHAPRMLI